MTLAVARIDLPEWKLLVLSFASQRLLLPPLHLMPDLFLNRSEAVRWSGPARWQSRDSEASQSCP